jgi:hypothetical protein
MRAAVKVPSGCLVAAAAATAAPDLSSLLSLAKIFVVIEEYDDELGVERWTDPIGHLLSPFCFWRDVIRPALGIGCQIATRSD